MNDEQQLRQEAQDHVNELKSFYRNLASYVVFNIILLIINLVTTPHNLWFYWVTIFWGLAMVYRGAKLFNPGKTLSKKWEQKKIDEYVEKRKK